MLPFILVEGNPATPRCLNAVGLKRHGFTTEELTQLRRAYKMIFRQGLKLTDIKQGLIALAAESKHVDQLLQAIEKSSRGFARMKQE